MAKAPFKLNLRGQPPVDPYLVWAALISFDGYGGGTGDNVLPFLIEWSFEAPTNADSATATDAASQLHSFSRASYDSRFQTVMLPLAKLPQLIYLLEKGAAIRFQLGAARGIPSQIQPVYFDPLGGLLVPLKTLGIVDDGCCLAHASFRGIKNSSRFLFVWDQSPRAKFSAATPWSLYQHAGVYPAYGAELINGDIERLLKKHPDLGEANERALYKDLGRPTWGAPGRIHGACVLHALAGPRSIPLPATEPISQDAASLPIIFVQLPDETIGDTSGGSIGFYVLDAARYIARRTAELSECSSNPGDWTTVINISLGSIGGPHDGSTIVERALDELVDKHKKDQVKVVMAAGNTAGRKLHAVREVTATNPGQFYVMVQPDTELESFVELWPQSSPNVPADNKHLRVTIKAPDGSILRRAKLGDIHVLKRHGVVVASLVRPLHVPQGENGTMILLAIRPTAAQDIHDTRVAPYGVWEILVESNVSAATVVHAWVERNDTTIGFRRPQQTMFVSDTPPEAAGYISDASTLSSLANGARTDCVGAFEVDRMQVTEYSANGPVLHQAPTVRPTLYGSSEQSLSLPGLRSPGFFSGSTARLSGTSSGAPRIARWHAEGNAPTQTVRLLPAPPTNSLKPVGTPEGIKPAPEFRR